MKICTNCKHCYPDDALICEKDQSPLAVTINYGPLLAARYQLNKELGKGRLGAGYRGSDLQTNEDVFIRIFTTKLFPSSEAVRAFASQLDAISRIDSPHLVRVRDWGKLDSTDIFVVTYFGKGGSLRDKLKQNPTVDFARAVEIIIQVCRGVAAAHDAGVIHGDLKPENVLIDSADGKFFARVCDFGLAAINESQGGSVETDTGSIIIRLPHYTSPEECSGKNGDRRSDIYSIGVMLYELLTGRLPFNAKAPAAVIVKQVSEIPVPPKQINNEIPPQIEEIVLKTLEKSPELRPASASVLADMLEQAAAGLGVGQSARASAGSADSLNKPPPPEAGLPVRLTIVDADDEGNKSRTIAGVVVDLSKQGMCLQTSAVESDSLNLIRDSTVAFKNRLNIEIDLPVGTVSVEGFAVWYKPAPDGINWITGVYIRDMNSDDRDLYNEYLDSVS